MLSTMATIICFVFFAIMSYNMIMFILSQRKHYDFQEEKNVKQLNKTRIKRIVILFILLPVIMVILFFGSYLLHR